jgi:hypothetical protein
MAAIIEGEALADERETYCLLSSSRMCCTGPDALSREFDAALLAEPTGTRREPWVEVLEKGKGQRLEHPNPDRYVGQRIFVVQREDYVYLVPFVEDEHTVFLKTIIPSRKATKQYLGEESDDED